MAWTSDRSWKSSCRKVSENLSTDRMQWQHRQDPEFGSATSSTESEIENLTERVPTASDVENVKEGPDCVSTHQGSCRLVLSAHWP